MKNYFPKVDWKMLKETYPLCNVECGAGKHGRQEIRIIVKTPEQMGKEVGLGLLGWDDIQKGHFTKEEEEEFTLEIFKIQNNGNFI